MRKVSRCLFYAALSLSLCACGLAPAPPTPDQVATRVAVAVAADATLAAESPEMASAPVETLVHVAVVGTLTAVAPRPTDAPAGPTDTPVPSQIGGTGIPSTPTRLAHDVVYDAIFQADVTVPDGTRLLPGESFTKTWRLKNTGDCPWDDGFGLVHVSGERFGVTAPAPVPRTEPGQSADLSVAMQAPMTPGIFRGEWQLRDGAGRAVGPNVYVQVAVGEVPPAVTNSAQPLDSAIMQVDDWEIKLERVITEASMSSYGSTYKAAGVFALVFLQVTNRGLRPDTFVAIGTLDVMDTSTTRSTQDSLLSSVAQRAHQTDFGVDINPDASAHVVVVYDVEPSSSSYRLVPGILARRSSGTITFTIP